MMDIKKILENAPSGATHCTDIVPSMNLYAKVEHLGGFYVSLSNRWEAYPIYAGIHLLDDLREIVKLQAERDALALEVDEANDRNAKLIEERDVLADQVRELARVLDEISSKRRAERDALAAELSKMCEFRDEVVGVMNESSGVVGWHKNHTVATWDELLPVVPDFESPQQCLREIEAKAVEKFFAHFESASFWDKTVNDVIDEGYEYAAKVRKGVNDVR